MGNFDDATLFISYSKTETDDFLLFDSLHCLHSWQYDLYLSVVKEVLSDPIYKHSSYSN